jgi:hypothetical protein
MTPISQTERFVLLLRERLAERARARSTGKTGAAALVGPIGLRAVVAKAASEGADDDQLRRALLEQLLVDRLGGGTSNEARFQQIVGEVYSIMSSDETLAAQFEYVISELTRRVV